MSQIVHEIGEIGEVDWVGKVKCVETPLRLTGLDCSSYCALRVLRKCYEIACTSQERLDGKSVHYELVKE